MRHAGRAQTAAHVAIWLAGAMYAWVATFGYLTFGSRVEEDVWASYELQSDAFVGIVRLGFFFSVLCTVPLILFPLRMSILALACADAPFRWFTHVAIAAAVVAGTSAVAIFVPSIKTVFSLVGATSSITLIFLLPAAIYLRCGPRAAPGLRWGPRPGPGLRSGPSSEAQGAEAGSRLLRAAAWLLLLLGLGVMGVALGFDLGPGGLFAPQPPAPPPPLPAAPAAPPLTARLLA